jgi:hypothetical protein
MNKIARTNNTTARGYHRDESGILRIIDLPFIDGQVTDYMGIPYDLSGEVVELMGWPDTKAIEISPRLLVGIQNK